MDDLQYFYDKSGAEIKDEVLNLVINGWPSIRQWLYGINKRRRKF